MTTRTFCVSGTPVSKARAQVVRLPNGASHSYTPAKTVNAEAEVRYAYKAAYPNADPHEGPLTISVMATFVPPISWPKWKRALALTGAWRHVKKPDGDNLVKLVKDALRSVAYLDDSQVFVTHIRKSYGDVPRTIVALALHEQPERGA